MEQKKSRMLRLTLMGGQARVFICDTTELAQQARDIHNASNTCSAAMGRMLAATAIMGANLKSEGDRITATINGGASGRRVETTAVEMAAITRTSATNRRVRTDRNRPLDQADRSRARTVGDRLRSPDTGFMRPASAASAAGGRGKCRVWMNRVFGR